MTVAPVRLDPAFDDPLAVIALCRRSAPYRLAAAVQGAPAGGADVPWFRTYWARFGELIDPAAAAVLHNARFIEAAKAMFSAAVVTPVSVMNNLNAPMAGGAPHVDIPGFLGAEDFPSDLLMAMNISGLFQDWAAPIASTISWFYRGEGGHFDYWPDGPHGPPTRLETPLWNTAILGDNETMFHQMGPVGHPIDRLGPGAVSRETRLLATDGSGWTLADGETRRRFAEDDIRISILWKALAFASERDQRRFQHRDHALTLPAALAIIDRDLKRRDLPRLDLDAGYDEATRLQVHAAYPAPRLREVAG